MAVVTVTSFTPSPGQAAQALAALKSAVHDWSGFGGRGGVYALARGGVPGVMNLVVEFADLAAYGAALDKVHGDPVWEAFLTRGQPSQALVPVRSVVYAEAVGLEVPFEEVAGCRAAVTALFQVRPGQQAHSLQRMAHAKAIAERHGARMRALQPLVSDPAGVAATVAYYPDFAAWARAAAAQAADPEWQALAAEAAGDEASADFLRSSLMRLV